MDKKILVPIDGSEPSKEALRYATKVAKKIGATLVALRVIKTDILSHHWISVKEKLKEELEMEAEEILQEAKKIAQQENTTLEGIVREGFVDQEIVKYVTENKEIIMVVMGSQGKDFITRRLLGSQTSKVAQQVGIALPCPLLIVPSKSVNPDARLIC
jgi:nucleotide-binding universal stress UspA family protein